MYSKIDHLKLWRRKLYWGYNEPPTKSPALISLTANAPRPCFDSLMYICCFQWCDVSVTMEESMPNKDKGVQRIFLFARSYYYIFHAYTMIWVKPQRKDLKKPSPQGLTSRRIFCRLQDRTPACAFYTYNLQYMSTMACYVCGIYSQSTWAYLRWAEGYQ